MYVQFRKLKEASKRVKGRLRKGRGIQFGICQSLSIFTFCQTIVPTRSFEQVPIIYPLWFYAYNVNSVKGGSEKQSKGKMEVVNGAGGGGE